MLSGESFYKLYRNLRFGVSGDGISVRTLTGNLTLTTREEQLCAYDPGGASRNVTIHVDDNKPGMFRLFRNTADADGENLVIKNSAATTICTIGRGETGIVAYGGSTPAWVALLLTDGMSDVLAATNAWTGANSFAHATGVTTDTVTERSASAGVTVDGALIKDGGATLSDSTTFIADNADATKKVAFQASGVTTGTTRTLTIQDVSGTVVVTGGTDLAVADGGTGASNAADAATNLGLGAASAVTFASVVAAGGVNATGGNVTADNVTVGGDINLSGRMNMLDGSVIQHSGAGTGSGDVIDVIGPDSTHGMKTVVYEATVSPSAIETALLTIPAMSVVDSVQANVQTALTGGGTTVTFGVGITGDVDLYGSAGNAGVQADLLTLNAKLDCFGTRAAGQGAGIGLFVAGTQAVKLIGAATGGASAGDTALTVGSVKVRIVYRSLMAMANA